MDEEVLRLLDHIGSGTRDEQQEIILQVFLVLERSSREVTGSDAAYTRNLTPHLLALRLSDDEQGEVVARLCALVCAGIGEIGSLLWAMGRASPNVLIRPLLGALRTLPSNLDPMTMRQALVALNNCLVIDRTSKTDKLLPEIARALGDSDPTAFLREVATSDSPDVATYAQRLLGKLERHYRGTADRGRRQE